MPSSILSLHVEPPDDLERSLRDLDIAVTRGLVLAGQIIVSKAEEIHERERPGTVATGRTKRSHKASPVKRFARGLKITVGPDTDYAKWGIGSGRPPGTPPPLKNLIQWLTEKGGGGTARDIYAMAQAAQRTIQIYGTKEYRVLERALDEEKDNILLVVATSVHAMLRKNAKR